MNDEIQIKNQKGDFETIIKTKCVSEDSGDTQQELDDLICHADISDYIVAAASGLSCGFIDSFFVNRFSLAEAQEWGTEKVNKFVIYVAKKQGFKSDSLQACVAFLERNNPYPSDSLTNEFGGGLQHHLRDFTHHCSLGGLAFSLLSQFTGKVVGTDVNGNLITVSLDKELIGKGFSEKIALGIKHWIFHVVSDLAGSSNSTRAGRAGSGLPGPVLSFFKRLSTTPLFGKENSETRKKLSLTISKLFNGTLINDNGRPIKFDFRTEIGIAASEYNKKKAVLLNEIIVRCFYFIRRLASHYKECESILKIDWEKVLPYKNPTVTRMLVVSSGVMVGVDLIRAFIVSKRDFTPFHIKTLMSINIVGIGSFVISLGRDMQYGVKSHKKKKEISKEIEDHNRALDCKTFIYYSNRWLIASTTRKCLLILSKLALSLILYKLKV